MKFQRCHGIRLFCLDKYQLELWYCPAGEIIPKHTHKECNSLIVFLFGAMTWLGNRNTITLNWKNIGWHMRVPIGKIHGAVVHKRSIFLNFEQWAGKPTSAAIDFYKET